MNNRSEGAGRRVVVVFFRPIPRSEFEFSMPLVRAGRSVSFFRTIDRLNDFNCKYIVLYVSD